MSKPTLDDIPQLPREASLGQLQEFEQAIRAMPEAVTEFEVSHHFAPGVYLRELVVPAGTVLVGKLHKTTHFLLITSGRLRHTTSEGTAELVASDIVTIRPGSKSVILVHEDCVMVSVHVTNSTDLTEIEREVIESEVQAREGEAA